MRHHPFPETTCNRRHIASVMLAWRNTQNSYYLKYAHFVSLSLGEAGFYLFCYRMLKVR
jgi:hypothetical protein